MLQVGKITVNGHVLSSGQSIIIFEEISTEKLRESILEEVHVSFTFDPKTTDTQEQWQVMTNNTVRVFYGIWMIQNV